MASIEEIIGSLQAAGQKVGEGVQLLAVAENSAGQLEGQMAAAGVLDKAAEFAQVREFIQRVRQHLLASQELANQVMNVARQAGG
jgi:hypothetical protein